MPSIASFCGKGWLKDYPDYRDNTPSTDTLSKRQIARGARKPVSEILEGLAEDGSSRTRGLPKSADLRQWCSPVDNQGQIGSCTAHACVGLYEYFERRAFGKHIDGSRLFLYKATRNLLGWEGDDGAYLRTTMAAMALFGVPPEKYWPYKEARFNEEPTAFIYAYAQNYQALLYYRLDVQGVTRQHLLDKIKQHLRMGLPLVFGFTCYTSLNTADNGDIPFPDRNEDVEGGHAVMAVGFDDDKTITNCNNSKIKSKGAILIRNSWSEEWGDRGYGWLPYDYILYGIADDWWSMTKGEWIDTKQFGL